MSGHRSEPTLGDWQADEESAVSVHPHLLRLHELCRSVHVPLVHRRPLLQVPARRLTNTMLHGLHAFGLAAQ